MSCDPVSRSPLPAGPGSRYRVGIACGPERAQHAIGVSADLSADDRGTHCTKLRTQGMRR